MINLENPRQLSIEEFKLPFGNELDPENRWVKLSQAIPWEELTEVYNKGLSSSIGRPALSARVVVGALVIKHMLKLSDEETIEQIRENPYLQYFLGYPNYSYGHTFEPSLFVSIRKRLGAESVDVINKLFIDRTKKKDTCTEGKGNVKAIKRDIHIIDKLLDERVGPFPLSCRDQQRLWVIREVYRQQETMSKSKTHRIEGRIVSISQPYVRPIVRGKAGSQVEFGPKISASVVDGNTFVDKIGWEAFNESCDLPMQVEKYFNRFGCYPEAVAADKIYGTSDNRAYLKKNGIRFSGVPLGRKPKDSTENKKEKKRRQKEAAIRNRIEGAFGVGKRKFGLGLVMTKLSTTSENWIEMVIFVMNISRWLRDIFVLRSFQLINNFFTSIANFVKPERTFGFVFNF